MPSPDSMLFDTSSVLENGFSHPSILTNNSQENVIGTVPVVYMPMSPISVVTPVQVCILLVLEIVSFVEKCYCFSSLCVFKTISCGLIQ